MASSAIVLVRHHHVEDGCRNTSGWFARGEGGHLVGDFEKISHAGIGWDEAGDFTLIETQDEMRRRMATVYPDAAPAALGNAAATTFEFRHIMAPGETGLRTGRSSSQAPAHALTRT